MKAKWPVLVGRAGDAVQVHELDRDAGIGRFLKRSRTTPSKLICGPAFTISLLDHEVVAVGDLHRRRLVVDLGGLEHELLRGRDRRGVEVGAARL